MSGSIIFWLTNMSRLNRQKKALPPDGNLSLVSLSKAAAMATYIPLQIVAVSIYRKLYQFVSGLSKPVSITATALSYINIELSQVQERMLQNHATERKYWMLEISRALLS